jgi:hypothetical protein
MILDRIISLLHFGFVYTDIDQMVLWNGAYDYSRGIFHEPFFYGQNFNYMVEAFLAAPLLWVHIPVYIALPVATSLISLFPFIILAILFFRRECYFWSYLCIAFPILLPLQYNFLTTISRGFVQAHLFVPLLFFPLFNPQSKSSVTILYLAGAICFFLNPSSLLISLPIGLFVSTYHFKSPSFYLKALLVIPFLIADYFAKHFYQIHHERILHELVGVKLDTQTLFTSLKNTNLFENLFPFIPTSGIIYPFLFIVLAIVAFRKSLKREFIFILSFLLLLLVSLAIPKVQEFIPNTGVFFTSSRLYLYLPLVLILATYLVFPQSMRKPVYSYMLLLSCGITLITKNLKIEEKAQDIITHTLFPTAKTQDLVARADELQRLAFKYNIDLIVHTTSSTWSYPFDSYAFNPLLHNNNIISVNIDDDRRTWLYSKATHCKQILLNGIKIDSSLQKQFDFEVLNNNQSVIKNNKLNVDELFTKLNLKFGNTPL